MLRTIVFVLVLLLGAVSFGAAEMVSADRIYADHKDSLVQVRISDRVAGAKSAIGSGFFVGDDGLIATNYHVVSELIFHPQDYQAAFYHENGQSGPLILLGVDVVHDLAILRAETVPVTPLRLAEQAPAQGERLFSLGNPHDLGMTIVEGTYNGLLQKSVYQKIHFTGSINPGMSGGPALNFRGEVVGVNVATAGNQLSFLVPVVYLKELLKTLAPLPPGNPEILEDIRKQLLANQDRTMSLLRRLPLKTTDFNGYQVPDELADFLKCWGDREPEEGEKLFEKAYKSCASNDDIYLSRELETGIFRFRNEVFSSEEMGSTRFFHFLQDHLNRPHLTNGGDEDSVSNYSCTSDFVEHGGIESKVIFCGRSYKKLEGLYDVFLTANSLTGSDEALHTTLYLGGVSRENALGFAREYLEAISWNR
ncbi:MAG: serine protease [Desulfuromonadaceae bacterium]